MKRVKKEQLKSEAKKFTLSGSVATVTDYGILNLLVLVFGLPVLAANLISTTLSSIISYRLNKAVVFEGRRHGRKRSVALYIAIIGVGIYIIQSGLLVLFQRPLMPLAEALSHIIPLSAPTIDVNISKMAAGGFAALWNYFMLRRFVFVPGTQKHKVETAD